MNEDLQTGNPAIAEELLMEALIAEEQFRELIHWAIPQRMGNPEAPLLPRLQEIITQAIEKAQETGDNIEQRNWQAAIRSEQEALEILDEFHDLVKRIKSMIQIGWEALIERRLQAEKYASLKK